MFTLKVQLCFLIYENVINIKICYLNDIQVVIN